MENTPLTDDSHHAPVLDDGQMGDALKAHHLISDRERVMTRSGQHLSGHDLVDLGVTDHHRSLPLGA
jgi:hypothetical protein